MASRIKTKLEIALQVAVLEIEDISSQHAEHAAVRKMEGGANETHFIVRIVVSSKFGRPKTSSNDTVWCTSSSQASKLLVLSAGLILIMILLRLSSLVWKDFKSSSSSVYICIIINSIVMLIAALSAFHHRHETSVSDLDVTEDHDMLILTGTQTPVPDSGAIDIEEDKRYSSQVIDTSTLYPDACDIDDSTNILAQCKEQYIRSSGNLMVEDHDEDHDMLILTGTPTRVPDSSTIDIEEAKRCSSQVIDTSSLYRDACDIDDSTNILAQCKEQYIRSSGDVMVEDHDDSKKTPNQPGSEHRVVERNPPASTELLLYEEMETRVPGSQPDDTENTMDMDAIWMTITGAGKPSHERKLLKESETRETRSGPPSIAAVEQHDREDLLLSAIDWKELRRPNTCNDAVSRRCRDGLKRDSSAGLDELNQQVEGFIKRFNEDMLLQRKESDRKLLDMIKRGL